VALLGEVPHEETVRHYQQAHVVVNPALRESFGRSLIESMSCEVPVVATDVGGMPDIVANRALGRIAPAGDPDALADAIDDVLADPHARQEMGSQGRRHVLSRYSWEAVVEQVLRHYGGALNAPSVAA
jgi:glycosyltransferase involved in cell wall biosynthesis